MAFCGIVVVDDSPSAVIAHELRRGNAADARAVNDDGLAGKVHTALAKIRVKAPASTVSTRYSAHIRGSEYPFISR